MQCAGADPDISKGGGHGWLMRVKHTDKGGMPPQEKFLISHLLRLFLGQFGQVVKR